MFHLITFFAAYSLLSSTNAYLLGESPSSPDFMRCWQNNRLLSMCPKGISISWNYTANETWFAETTHTILVNVSYTKEFSQYIVDKRRKGLFVPHINLHACQFSLGRVCVPFILADGNSVQHSEEHTSKGPKLFSLQMKLPQASWNIIAHLYLYSNDSTIYSFEGSSCNVSNQTIYPFPWRLDAAIGQQLLVVAPPIKVQVQTQFYVSFSNWMNIIMIVIIMLTYVISIGGCAVVLWFKDERIIHAAQPMFLLCMALGGIVVISAAWAAFGSPDFFTCNVPWAIWCVGFTIYFGTYLLRVWRVLQVFVAARTLSEKVIHDHHVLARLGALLLIDAGIIACAFLYRPFVKYEERHVVDGVALINRSCTSSGLGPWHLMVLYKVGFVLVGIVFSVNSHQLIQDRIFRRLFVESAALAAGIYITCFAGVIGAFIITVWRLTPAALWTLVTTLSFLSFMSSYVFLVAEKVYRILKDDPINRAPGTKLNSDESSKTSGNMSTTEIQSVEQILMARIEDLFDDFEEICDSELMNRQGVLMMKEVVQRMSTKITRTQSIVSASLSLPQTKRRVESSSSMDFGFRTDSMELPPDSPKATEMTQLEPRANEA